MVMIWLTGVADNHWVKPEREAMHNWQLSDISLA